MKRPIQLLILLITLFLISCGGDNGTPNPAIDGIQPESGPPGTMVTINGSGFSPEAANNAVTFDGTQAPVNNATESTIETQVPKGLSTGSVQIEVTVGDQTVTGPGFMVEQSAPGISSVEPDSGTAGTKVRITGMNFSSNAAEVDITFDGTNAPVNGAAQDQLMTEVPQGATDGPIEVTVKQKSTTGPDFDVITEGTMEVITSTSGQDQDPDGYTINVDGSASESTGNNDTKYFTKLEEGNHEAELSGIADNCSVLGKNPRNLSITAGDTTSTTFELDCIPVAQNKIAFASNRDGDLEIFTMNADGSDQQNLSNIVSTEYYPAISHDGTKVAYYSTRNTQTGELFVMNVDGSNVQQVTNTAGDPLYYSWSPDDSKILFQDDRGSNNDEIFVINADGSGLTQITDNASFDRYPSWSPDGNKIAFASNRDGDAEIYTINPDGTNLQKLTDNISRDYAPRWSPDGSKIAITTDRDGNDEIYTLDADGSNPQRISNSSASDQFASWSPDGSELVFQTDRDGNSEVYRINADGSGSPINLTTNSARDEVPFWSPVQ